MSTVTLAESAKLTQDMLVAGVIENIITVNPFYDVVPFHGISGNALGYNRENVLGDVQMANVGDTITAKNPATFTYVTSNLTTIIGDAEVNGLIQATRSNKVSQKATQVASKAKSAGRKYQDQIVNGTGAAPQMPGMLSLVDPTKKGGVGINTGTAATNGGALSFADLDWLIRQVTDKDGEVDFLMMQGRTIDSFYALCRAAGGASISETISLPSGRKVPQYRGIPIFRNDWLPTNQVTGTLTTGTSVFAGTLDDGSMTHGIAGLTAETAAGIQVVEVGESETKDESITRVKWYSGLALFSLNGLAALTGVSN